MSKVIIASWNVNSIKVRMPHIAQWVDIHQPDILAMQEIKTQDQDFPIEAFTELGYEIIFTGQKSYNGVAIASRQKPIEIATALPDFPDEQRRILATTINGIRIVNVYTPNGESLDSDKFTYKLKWLEALQKFLQEQLMHYEKLLVLGDFNIAPKDEDVYDPLAWKGHVLVSSQERDAFQKLLSLGFSDSFRLFEQVPDSYSWWDYRMGAFRRNHGLRIDHILVNNYLKERCISAVIDKLPRGWERPSDHAPILATFDFF